ncbi:MAG TPA: beta-propeller fold lactonase family protein [Acidobacteriaceae bacterium]|nr:beta-propeller fold lactonase family protein [Acidobacteriaceae bacterium]
MQVRFLGTYSIVLLLCAGLSFSGCGKFFVDETTPPSSGGNYFYVGNMTTSNVAGFSVGTSNISGTSDSPYTLGVVPSAMTVTPGGSYVYVSTLAGAIYGYSVGSNGALTLLNGGNALITGISPVAIKVDPSGKWLVAVDQSPAAYVFSINTSTGALTQEGNALALDPGSPKYIAFTPNNTLVYVSLGTGGVDIFTFNVSSGVLTKTNQILKPKAAVNGDQGLAVDPGGKFLFVAETGAGGVRVLSIASTGALTEVSGSPFATGVGPAGVLVDSTGNYVYVTNRTDGTVSAFTLASTGSLTKISGSPFSTGSEPVDLVEDTAGTHIGVACAGGTPDFQVFTIGIATSSTPGGLTSFANSTASTPTGAFAVVAAD